MASAIPAPPAGSYYGWGNSNSGQVYTPNGQPYLYMGQPVYTLNGVDTTQPIGTPASTSQQSYLPQLSQSSSNPPSSSLNPFNGWGSTGAGPGTVKGSSGSVGKYKIPGAGEQQVYETSTGTPYYLKNGQPMAISANEVQNLRIPSIAGYTPQGQPIYYKPPAGHQPTPEQNALKQTYQTDPGLQPIVNNLQSYYKNLANSTLNGNLDPATLNEVQQASRAAQVARGNALGTSQAAQEAMTTGLTGYQMGQQNAQNIASYINSGTTPAAMGARSLSDIINEGQSANSSTPFQSTYNPSQTFSYLNPNAGNQFSTGANNWYNSENYQYLGSGAAGAGGNPGMGAATGALSGAASGASIGTAFYPGIGTLIGAGVGALAGGGLGAASQSCWVARECLGSDNPQWMEFRNWLLGASPSWLRNAYLKNGEKFASYISNRPVLKGLIRGLILGILRISRKHTSRYLDLLLQALCAIFYCELVLYERTIGNFPENNIHRYLCDPSSYREAFLPCRARNSKIHSIVRKLLYPFLRSSAKIYSPGIGIASSCFSKFDTSY